MYIILPVAALGGMGLLFGALLAIASRIFAVKEDERIPLVLEVCRGQIAAAVVMPAARLMRTR